MTNFNAGDVVLIPFPFTDLTTHKKRPALILCGVVAYAFGNLYTCSMITGQIEGEDLQGDYLIHEWKESGLLHPSKLRLAKVVTIEENLVDKKIGVISKSDQKQIKNIFNKLYKKWI